MRLPVATALLAALALAPAAAASPVLEYGDDGATVREDPHLPPRSETDLPPPRGAAATSAAPKARSASRPTVKQAVRRAFRAGKITRAERRQWLSDWRTARRTRSRLSGPRRAQLHSVLRTIQRIAATDQLSPSRMPAVFLLVRRNAEFWPGGPYPASGQRIEFEGSELVFQYYAGQGLQIQPLANFGKANALWRSGRRARLRNLLDEMVEIASRRGRFTTWEYWFSFGGGSPPWISAMAQGTAIQALARGADLLEDRSYRRVARRSLQAFRARAPRGVRVAGRSGGNHYLIYSFSRGLRVLNAFTQTLNGLHDYATITGHGRGMRLFELGDRSLRAELPAYDTGAWSLYSLGGSESTLEYHDLSREFLAGLCERTGHGQYCDTAGRFEAYRAEPPRMSVLTRRLRARSRQFVRFTLSKRSTVRMTISRDGRVVHSATLAMGYGTRAFAWEPPRRGTYEVSLSAQSFLGTSGSATGTIQVRPRR